MAKLTFTKTDQDVEVVFQNGDSMNVPFNSLLISKKGGFIYLEKIGVSINSPEQVDNIDGDAPAGTLEGIKDQLSAIFNTPGGGGGGGGVLIDPLYAKMGPNGLILLGIQGPDEVPYTVNAGNVEILLVTPAAPTLPVTDDVSKVMEFTKVTGFPNNSDYEYTLNGGMSVLDLSTDDVPAGNGNKAIGQVGVRVKETVSNNHSAWLFNTVAFTYSPPVEVPMINWHGVAGSESTVSRSGNDITGLSLYGQIIANYKLASGNDGYVMWSLPDQAYGVMWCGGADELGNYGTSYAGAYFRGEISDIVIARVNGGGGSDYSNQPLSPGTDARIRINIAGSVIALQVSSDAGQTWTDITTRTRPAGDIFFKTQFEALLPINKLNDIVGNGLTAF